MRLLVTKEQPVLAVVNKRIIRECKYPGLIFLLKLIENRPVIPTIFEFIFKTNKVAGFLVRSIFIIRPQNGYFIVNQSLNVSNPVIAPDNLILQLYHRLHQL